MKHKNENILKRISLFACCALVCFYISSCDKNDDDQPPRSFTWSYDGLNYTARLDTAYTNIAFGPLILATANNPNLFFPSAELQIGVTSFNPGTYTFSPAGPNKISFTDPMGFSYASNSGSIIITTNTNNFISGSFTSALNSGKTITGSFTNTAVKP